MVHRNTRSRKIAVAIPESRGTKRKRPASEAHEGSDGEPEEGGGDRSRSRTCEGQSPVVKEESTIADNQSICICPRNVMKCIGILPSLPIIMNQFCDSDDSDSSANEDFSHTVLPTVSRGHSTGEA